MESPGGAADSPAGGTKSAPKSDRVPRRLVTFLAGWAGAALGQYVGCQSGGGIVQSHCWATHPGVAGLRLCRAAASLQRVQRPARQLPISRGHAPL